MKPQFSSRPLFLLAFIFIMGQCSSPSKAPRFRSYPKKAKGDFQRPIPQLNTESYNLIQENEFRSAKSIPISTFSIDVDNASYSNVRRFLNQGQKPPKDAVRIEEMLNYFSYEYPEPEEEKPLAIYHELSECPWNPKHQLLHLGLQAKKIPKRKLPASNLVFLVDASGSMQAANKMPLLKAGLKLLIREMRPQDQVAIVAYAGAAGLVLPSTSGKQKDKIMAALDEIEAGGSTAGGEGIELAYDIAQENFISNANNRVIIATDGDFNIGASSDAEMVRLIEKKRETGIYLTCLGLGMGNLKDSKMEQLADKGNGNYSYIDNIQEAQKVLVTEFGGTLFTVAKDVKIQVEFNAAKVQAYRLIGYENRLLNEEDFENDQKDAGEIGAGHTVTALYEIIPIGVESEYASQPTNLRYQEQKITAAAKESEDLLWLKVRYKEPNQNQSKLMEQAISQQGLKSEECSANFNFSAAVAGFGMLLRNSKFKGSLNYAQVLELAEASKGEDSEGYRSEFIRLVKSLE